MQTRGIGFQTDALLAPEQALTLYFSRAQLRPAQIERVSLERALRRVLAEPVVCDGAYPPVPRSAMDGFAVCSADTPGRVVITGEIRMGRTAPALAPKSALRIPTGGMLPDGADAVVPVEDALVEGQTVEVAAAVPPGDCVTPAGSDMRAGETLLRPGRRLGAAELGVLATLGLTEVHVYRTPVFAVLSGGDELVAAGETPGPAQVRDSNRWAVAGVLEALGAAVHHLPIAPDDAPRLEALLREALAACDGVVLTGGSSVGERDATPEVVARLGAPGVLVHGLRVKPGKPTLLACVDGKPIVGLPGNPASALMMLEGVVAPVVSTLVGARCAAAQVEATLGADVRKRAGWTWYLPVRLDQASAAPVAYPLELRSSSTSLLARASGYTVLGEAIESLTKGTAVRVTRFLVGGEY